MAGSLEGWQMQEAEPGPTQKSWNPADPATPPESLLEVSHDAGKANQCPLLQVVSHQGYRDQLPQLCVMSCTEHVCD